jgi:hypothetical protein
MPLAVTPHIGEAQSVGLGCLNEARGVQPAFPLLNIWDRVSPHITRPIEMGARVFKAHPVQGPRYNKMIIANYEDSIEEVQL